MKRTLQKKFLPLFILLALGITIKAQSKYDAPADIQQLLMKNACSGCHKSTEKLVGPSYLDISKKKYSNEKIVELVHTPKPSNWPGYPAMAALPTASKVEVTKIAVWINGLKKK